METKLIPAAASADGKRNAHYLNCKPLEQQRAYCACLNILKQSERGTLNNDLYGDCDKEIRNGHCIAKGMRQEEELQGQAIYFVERSSISLNTGVGDTMGKFIDGLKKIAGITKTSGVDSLSMTDIRPRGERISKKKKDDDFLDSIAAPSYGDVLTDMVAEARKIDVRPGETPLEAARRISKEQSQSQE